MLIRSGTAILETNCLKLMKKATIRGWHLFYTLPRKIDYVFIKILTYTIEARLWRLSSYDFWCKIYVCICMDICDLFTVAISIIFYWFNNDHCRQG